MESQTKYGNVHGGPPLPILGGQPYNGLKLEVIDDDFCIDNFSSSSSSSKTYLQDFHHLDQLPLIKASPFNPDHIDTHTQLTVFDPFFHGFDLLYDENKAYDHGNGMALCAANAMQLQSFHGDGGFLNRKDMFMEMDAASISHDPNPFTIVVPDESSCVTADHFHKEIDGFKRGKCGGSASTKTGRRKAKSGKGQWTAEEDRLLMTLVEKHGEKKWSRIAQLVKGRIGKQCRERWHNHLRPDIKKDVWTEEEDRVLIEGHAEMGNKWAEIAKRLPGRTENSIKNHWNATKRRQQSRRKCKTKWPRPSSLLQNYIKSLTTKPEIPTNSSNNAEDNVVHDGYEIDDVPDFSFMDELPATPPPHEVQDEGPCFHLDPFDMPPLMLKEELDFAMG